MTETRSQAQSLPQLRRYITMEAVESMPAFAGLGHSAILDAIQHAGYHGVQFGDAHPAAAIADCVKRGLGMAQFREIRVPSDAGPAAESLAAQGAECGIIHLGYGLEDDTEAAHLIEAVIVAAEKHKVPLYIETHRATLTQDLWRTVQFALRFPELRFNGDFSHWYTGQEMVYGDFDRKLKFIAPVFERVRFLHGRIGNPGCIQVDLGDGDPQRHPYIAHFKQLWTAAFAGFLASAAPADSICFTPELLYPEIYYARVFPNAEGRLVEESDRWQQSLLLASIAEDCFADALSHTLSSSTTAPQNGINEGDPR
jgi:sugar phosphate isomerase/epimerase